MHFKHPMQLKDLASDHNNKSAALNIKLQVDLMIVLSVPQLSSGTVGLVRSHPVLTTRQLPHLRYAGS